MGLTSDRGDEGLRGMEWGIRVFKEPDGLGYSLREVFYAGDAVRAYDADPIATEASLEDLLDYANRLTHAVKSAIFGSTPLLEACDEGAREVLITGS